MKSSVRIKFKLPDETVPVFEISSSKFGTSIVTVAALTVPVLAKSISGKISAISNSDSSAILKTSCNNTNVACNCKCTNFLMILQILELFRRLV